MGKSAIKVENLSKLYRLGQIGTGTLRHDVQRWWAQLRGREDPFAKIGQLNDRTKSANSDYVWALKDINFEVQEGEVLGIIGRNGAGKSTLLKILSKITSPTTGYVKVKGRIASLLEVGTGFHPEMTGRENIFLNGAILGMRILEVQQKFDDIVDFAGVEAYIDTPVKRYSSGMYVRLAFAVAAFLKPDILIVDEVLAVGDAEFQKKCLWKMEEVSKREGRTVLLVSHNMASISNLCDKSILLIDGVINSIGATDTVLKSYLNGGTNSINSLNDRKDRYGTGELKFNDVKIYCSDTLVSTILSGADTIFELYYNTTNSINNVLPAIGFASLNGDRKTILYSKLYNHSYNINTGCGVFKCRIRNFPLAEGRYKFNLLAEADGQILDWVRDAGFIDVVNGDFYKTGRTIDSVQNLVLIEHEWI